MAERQLVEVARLLGRNARLLILDEPTASLTHNDSAAVFRALRQVADERTGILYVSHRLGEVLDLCSHITVLRDGAVVGDHRSADLDHDSLVKLIVGEEDGGVAGSARVPLVPHVQTPLPPTVLGGVTIERVSVPSRVADFSLQLSPGEGGSTGRTGRIGHNRGATCVGWSGTRRPSQSEVWRKRTAASNPRGGLGGGVFFISNDRKSEGLFLARSVSQNLIATRLPSISRLGIVPKRAERRAAQTLALRAAVSERVLSAPVSVLMEATSRRSLSVGASIARRGVSYSWTADARR